MEELEGFYGCLNRVFCVCLYIRIRSSAKLLSLTYFLVIQAKLKKVVSQIDKAAGEKERKSNV